MAANASGPGGAVTVVTEPEPERAEADEVARNRKPTPTPRSAPASASDGSDEDVDEDVDEGGQESTSTDEADGAEQPRADTENETKRWHGWVIAALAVICVALVGAGAVVGVGWWQGSAQEAQRQQAMDAATDGVENLLTLRPSTVEATAKEIVNSSTGAFKKDFEARKKVFVDAIKEEEVTSSGEIRAVGVESFDGERASVLIAASSTVSNKASKDQPQDRDYRIRVQTEKHGDRWLVAQVEFVP